MKAEGLHHVAAVLVFSRNWLIGIRGKELLMLLQGCNVLDAGCDLLRGHVLPVRVLLQDDPGDLLRGMVLVKADDVIGHVVHQVDRTAAGIQNDVVAIQFILMMHVFLRMLD